MSALERAQGDIETGDLGMARLRLASYLSTKGYDPAVLAKLGQVLYEMHNPYEAGRAWLTSSAQGDEVDKAIGVFVGRGGLSPKEIAKRLPKFTRLNTIVEYPQPARERLERLGFDNQSIRFVGDPCIPEALSRKDKIFIGVMVVGFVGGVICFAVGAIVGGQRIISWLKS